VAEPNPASATSDAGLPRGAPPAVADGDETTFGQNIAAFQAAMDVMRETLAEARTLDLVPANNAAD